MVRDTGDDGQAIGGCRHGAHVDIDERGILAGLAGIRGTHPRRPAVTVLQRCPYLAIRTKYRGVSHVWALIEPADVWIEAVRRMVAHFDALGVTGEMTGRACPKRVAGRTCTLYGRRGDGCICQGAWVDHVHLLRTENGPAYVMQPGAPALPLRTMGNWAVGAGLVVEFSEVDAWHWPGHVTLITVRRPRPGERSPLVPDPERR